MPTVHRQGYAPPSHPPMSDLGGGDRSHHRGTCSSGTETEQHAAPWRRRPPRSAISYLGGTQKEHVILLEKKRLFTDVRSRSTVFTDVRSRSTVLTDVRSRSSVFTDVRW